MLFSNSHQGAGLTHLIQWPWIWASVNGLDIFVIFPCPDQGNLTYSNPVKLECYANIKNLQVNRVLIEAKLLMKKKEVTTDSETSNGKTLLRGASPTPSLHRCANYSSGRGSVSPVTQLVNGRTRIQVLSASAQEYPIPSWVSIPFCISHTRTQLGIQMPAER